MDNNNSGLKIKSRQAKLKMTLYKMDEEIGYISRKPMCSSVIDDYVLTLITSYVFKCILNTTTYFISNGG